MDVEETVKVDPELAAEKAKQYGKDELINIVTAGITGVAANSAKTARYAKSARNASMQNWSKGVKAGKWGLYDDSAAWLAAENLENQAIKAAETAETANNIAKATVPALAVAKGANTIK